MGLFSCCSSSGAVESKTNPLEAAENEKKIHAYSWWRRLGRPTKGDFEDKILTKKDADITKADIDLLPWNEAETAVDEAKMNKLIYKRSNAAGQSKSDTNASQSKPLTEGQKRQRAYEWWGRLYKPTKTDFEARVKRIKHIELDIGDIDLLPWNEDETAVDELQMFQLNRSATIQALTASLQHGSYREKQAIKEAEEKRAAKDEARKERAQDDASNDKKMTGEQRALYAISQKKKKEESTTAHAMGERDHQAEKKKECNYHAEKKKERAHVEARKGEVAKEADQEQAVQAKKKQKKSTKKKHKAHKEIV